MAFLFGGKKKEEYVPTDVVERYAAQGMSEHDIASRLQNQGFTREQIDSALRSAVRTRVTNASEPVFSNPPLPSRRPEPEETEIPETPTMQMLGPAAEPYRAEPTRPPIAPPPFRPNLPPVGAPTGAPPAFVPPGPAPPTPRFASPMPAREPEAPLARRFVPPERIVPPTEPPPRIFEQAPPEIPAALEEGSISEIGEVTLEELIEGVLAEKWSEFEEKLELSLIHI